MRAVRCSWQCPSLYSRFSSSPWTRRPADVTSKDAPLSLPFRKLPRCDGHPDIFCRRFNVTTSALSSATQTDGHSGKAEAGDLLAQLEQRGLIESCSGLEDLREMTQRRHIKLYCGFDPTADCLHLGNLLGLIMLMWFHRYGHVPIALIGGATGRVGDPSGKQTERPLLTETQLQTNSASIQSLIKEIFEKNTTTEGTSLQLVNNLDWFGEMRLLEFLRDVGKRARLGSMMSKESVKSRIMTESGGSGLSFTEFSYQLLQGYDFYHLCRQDGIELQIGGSDQWGNITAGLDLIKRLWPSNEAESTAQGLTFPLLVDSEGKKFGKSEGGAVWLSPEKLSPYKFYQYLFSTKDVDVIRFMKMLTFVPLSEIETIESDMAQAPESGYLPNAAQKRLAEEVTRMVHGEEGLQQALAATEALRPGSETKLDVTSLTEAAGEAPTATLQRSEVLDAYLTDIFVKVKMQESKGAVRRMIRNGGIRVNNQKIQDEKMKVTEGDLIDGQMLLLAAGKKNKLLLKVTS